MSTIKSGDHVFFRHPEHSWVCGIVKSKGKEGVVCIAKDPLRKEITQNETVTLKTPDDVEQMHAESLDDSHHDLLNLTVLHEATLLRCLYTRYINDVVYTNIGAIVVALNPFNFSIPWYQDSKMQNYLHAGRNLSGTSMPANLLPHSWAQAHIAYFEMMDSEANQCIIVSGESGAGKTEAIKMVLKYLGRVSSLAGKKEEQRAAQSVGEKLVACSPILECFGNAKTLRNDNSSRFAKFMRVNFNSNYLVVGAETIKYLLEKSRVISSVRGERLFHSFYLLFRAKGNVARVLDLEHEKHYTSLSSGGTMKNTEYDTESDFEDVCHSMRLVGMTETEITSVWRVAAAVMTLLNVRFLSEEDGCSIDSRTIKYLKKAVKLLDIDEGRLVHELLTTTLLLPGNQSALKKNDVVAAIDIRDAMCKHLYDGVFGWLVKRCNDLCNVECSGNWIGLLDIFGFENFKVNSFEQLCINLANEHLQQHYNLHVFKRDMEECSSEGVDVTEIRFADNIECLNMLTAQGGIFPLLDECCWLGGGTDLGFLEKVVSVHESNPCLRKERVSGETFCVRHCAADVTYNVLGWIEKNRDTLKDSIKTLVRNSGNSVIAACLPAPISPSERKKGGNLVTVSGFFRNQLKTLMDLISSTNPHWIRCIKPNPNKKPKMFNGREVMNQLEFSGVLGTMKIRKAGYPVRIPRASFCGKYRICSSLTTTNDKNLIQDVLERAQLHVPSMAQIGNSKVFLKAEALNILERFRNQHLLPASLTLQRIARGYASRRALFGTFALHHRTELIQAMLIKAMKQLCAKETKSRCSWVLEENEAWGSLRTLEKERRLSRETIETKERERKHAEEKRRRREEEKENNRRIQEARRVERIRKIAATCIQRYVRGLLVRNRLYRQLLEERRAAMEYECELVCERERAELRHLDAQRVMDETSWIEWLDTADYLKYKKREDENWLLGRSAQKIRISLRELMRKEEQVRLKLEVSESNERCVLLCRYRDLTTYNRRIEEERRRWMTRPQRNYMEVLRPQPAGIRARAERSAASDARMQKTLIEYALSRTRLYDRAQESQQDVSSIDLFSSRSCREKSIFSQVQKSWSRQQEWLGSEDLALAKELNSRLPLMPEKDDGQFNGPHRTIEASIHSISPMLQLSPQPALLAATGYRSKGRVEPSRTSNDVEVKGKKKKNASSWGGGFRS